MFYSLIPDVLYKLSMHCVVSLGGKGSVTNSVGSFGRIIVILPLFFSECCNTAWKCFPRFFFEFIKCLEIS